MMMIIKEKQDAGSQFNPVTSSLHLKDNFTQKLNLVWDQAVIAADQLYGDSFGELFL